MNICKTSGDNRQHGFTLIEMLIVIVIIFILSGMVLKIMTMVSDNTAKTRCKSELLQIENALAEYYSEYGQYPPGVDEQPQRNVDYEYENAAYQPPGFRDNFLVSSDYSNTLAATGNPYFPDIIVSADNWPRYVAVRLDRYAVGGHNKYQQMKNWGIGYNYGLYSHLWERDMEGKRDGTDEEKRRAILFGGQFHWYRKDSERDKRLKIKLASLLSNVTPLCNAREEKRRNYSNVPVYSRRTGKKYLPGEEFDNGDGSNKHEFHDSDSGGSPQYLNSVYTVRDPWGHGLYYECKPPYYSYKLWSAGPDGQSYSDQVSSQGLKKYNADDIYAGKN